MPFVTRNTLVTLVLLAGIALLAVAGFVWSGVYNVGADDHHTRPVYAVMEALRERSIQARASDLQVPALNDPARITQGAGNYDAMCTGCHLKPGVTETELSKGLYPAPPDLTKQAVDAAEAFWVIKHGIKASGMPAWGKSMEDEYIWNMVAFVQELPKLDAARYQALVASSGGHSHGGGETKPHEHAEGTPDDHADMPMGDMPMDESKPHSHPPGTPPHDDSKAGTKEAGQPAEAKPHSHPPGTPAHDDAPKKPSDADHADPPAPAAAEPAAEETAPTDKPADDGHDHQH